jgi:Lipocalin-like domain
VEWRIETVLVTDRLRGAWRLVAWRRIGADGAVSYPIGADAQGQLIYAENGRMAVQLMAAGRPELATGDPLGGDVADRAAAYSTYLAYFGTYELAGDTVVHYVDGCLFPNWSDDKQIRPFTIDGDELVLRTPPMADDSGATVVNELVWTRDGS